MTAQRQITLKEARATLRVGAKADDADLRRAFHAAVMAAHPDRPGGGIEAFRHVMDAYGRLKNATVEDAPVAAPPAADDPDTLTITPLAALRGDSLDHPLADGGTIRVHLPAGLRAGDTLRVGARDLTIHVRNDGEVQLRGHDLWITAATPVDTLAHGGRLRVATPAGPRILWVTRKALEHGMVRLADEGLPPRGDHPRGHLYVRLVPEAQADSPARAQLRRFAATWAA